MNRDIQDRSFRFACRIVELHKALAQKDATARVLCGQLLRSGTSIGANLEEATAGQSKADFISKCSIALKEARETMYWLRLLQATGIIDNGDLQGLLTESNELISILTTIVRKARGINR